MRRNLRLRERLLILTFFIAIPAFILIYLAHVDQRRHDAEQAQANALALVRSIATQQDHFVSETRVLLATLAEVPQVDPAHPQECQAFLMGLDNYLSYRMIGVATPEGDIVCSTHRQNTIFNISDRPYFQRATSLRAFASSDLLTSRLTGEPALIFAAPILNRANPDRELHGVIIASVELTWLERRISSHSLPAGTTVTIHDRFGTVIARHPDNTDWQGQTIPLEASLLQTVLDATGEGATEGIGVDGTPQIVAYMPLPTLPESAPMFVTVEMPKAVAYAHATEMWRRNLLWLAIGMLLMIILAWWGSEYLIQRPVDALHRTAKRFAMGDLAARVGLDARDELGELAQTFDQMAASLQAQIEETRQVEIALRTSEERFRLLAENANDVIYQYEATEERRVNYISPSITAMTGYTPDDFYHDPRLAYTIIHPEDRVKRDESRPQREQSATTSQVRWISKNGQVIWVEISGMPVHDATGKVTSLTGIVRDITERKEAEQRLQELEDLYRRAIAAAGAVPYRRERDGDEWRFAFIGQGVEKLTGFRVDELTPALLHSAIKEHLFSGPLAGLSLEEAVFQVVNGAVEAWTSDILVVTRSGEERWLADASVELRDQGGQSTGSIGLLLDITDRKRAEAELRQAKEVAEAATRAKAEFLANMSHEIRTPLNAIIGMTSLLLDTPLSLEQGDFVKTIQGSGDVLLKLINDILDFSKIESGKLDLEIIPFDLLEVIEQTLDIFVSQTERKGLELGYTLASTTPHTVISDPGRVRQMLTNLVANAVKFTSTGEIVVTVDSGSTASGLTGSQAEAGYHQLHFAVRDTGIGISPEGMARLFKSFSQVDASTTRHYGGTGLGLAISRRLCEMMGGEMWVESEVGMGSTFHFTILAQAAPAQFKMQRPPVDNLRGMRVLVVDDHPTSLKILTHQLTGWQMQPIALHSPAAALEMVSNGEHFDLIILDQHMPEMDGMELAARLRQLPQTVHVPMVMLSSLGTSAAATKELKLAALLTKPVKQAHLHKVLVETLTPQSLPAPAPAPTPSVVAPSDLRILLTEDNLVNQKVASHLLARMGYAVDIANNGVEALAALQHTLYDVVLMDVQMPEMDGMEATRLIHEQWPVEQWPYIIAMTAHALSGDAEKCLAAGMDDYVSKPVHRERLEEALERGRLARRQASTAQEVSA